MQWLTVIWSMTLSACITLALMHLSIWLKDRSNLALLLFSIAAISVAGVGAGELLMMRAQTPQELGLYMRWTHVPLFIAIVSAVAFVYVYFDTGRGWLALTIGALRLLILIINFSVWPNVNFTVISAVHQRALWGGERIAVVDGVVRPWTGLANLASILFLVFVIDAAMRLWRKGNAVERRHAAAVGGSLAFFILMASSHTVLVQQGIVHTPYLISILFLVPLAVMAHQLGSDVVHVSQLSQLLEISQSNLREAGKRVELAAAAAELGFWEWDVGRDSIWVTNECRAMLGFKDAEDINFRRFLESVHPDDRESVGSAIKESVGNGGEYERQYRSASSNGHTRWLGVRGRVEIDGERGPLLVRGVVFDVTQRKQAEEHFRLVVEAAPNAMILVDASGVIRLVNAQTEAVFAYGRDEMIGRPIQFLLPERLHESYLKDRASYLAHPHSGPLAGERELFGRRKDGSEVPIEIGLNPIHTDQGTHVLASIIDITQRRQAEKESARQRNELAHLSRVAMLGELSGSLAHELNQPLTAILSNAQAAQRFLSRDEPDFEEVRASLQDIVDEGKRAGEVIYRLRVLFKKGEVQQYPLDLNEVVVDVLKLLNSDLVNHMIVARSELRDNLPRVHGDRVQLQQVLINLIMNGCDAMADADAPNRQLLVRTEFADGEGVQLSVTDHGTGIVPERMEAIFEPFVTTKHQGMGLGLAVCRTIVSAHGGRLWVTNNPDRGATFHVTLPSTNAGGP